MSGGSLTSWGNTSNRFLVQGQIIRCECCYCSIICSGGYICCSQGDWPLSLIVSVETEHRQKEYCYTPQSDFHISVDNLVSLLVEVQSDSHESDRYRMLLQAACMARLGRLFYNKLFIVVALYIDNTGEVTRYFVFQPDDTDWVCTFESKTILCFLTTFRFPVS
jgi:hypothetical protein